MNVSESLFPEINCLSENEKVIILDWYRAKNRYYSKINLEISSEQEKDELSLLRKLLK